MAKVTQQNIAYKPKKTKTGVAAKSKTSTLKSSKNYVKPYKGQGK